MNPNQLVQNPFFQEIENPILTRSQNSDLYTILSQGHGYLNIFGECGTGKTTILKALGKIDVKPIGGLGELSQLTQFICLYIDCKTRVISQSPDTFWNVIFKELDRKLKDKGSIVVSGRSSLVPDYIPSQIPTIETLPGFCLHLLRTFSIVVHKLALLRME